MHGQICDDDFYYIQPNARELLVDRLMLNARQISRSHLIDAQKDIKSIMNRVYRCVDMEFANDESSTSTSTSTSTLSKEDVLALLKKHMRTVTLQAVHFYDKELLAVDTLFNDSDMSENNSSICHGVVDDKDDDVDVDDQPFKTVQAELLSGLRELRTLVSAHKTHSTFDAFHRAFCPTSDSSNVVAGVAVDVQKNCSNEEEVIDSSISATVKAPLKGQSDSSGNTIHQHRDSLRSSGCNSFYGDLANDGNSNDIDANDLISYPSSFEGWMTKRGAKWKSWKRRYFKLIGTFLLWFERPDSFVPIKAFNVALCFKICMVEDDDKYRRPNCFEIKAPGRDLILSCDRADERRQWVSHLYSSIPLFLQV